jgi:hypothetical protein
MRSELEAAMGRVITNQQACASFIDDPRGFAAGYRLSRAEVESLLAMRDDLAGLMPSFTQKRFGMLRRTAHRTLGLLGDRSGPIVREFCDLYPPVDDLHEGQLAFAAFLVERTAELAPTLADGELIADMARYERALIGALWAARPLQQPSARRAPAARSPRRLAEPGFDAGRGLRLIAGASIAEFDWDLRSLRQYDIATAATLPRDHCILLFFHNGQRDGARIVRVQPFIAMAISTVRDNPGISAEAACAELDHADRAVDTLSRLSSQGAITWC